MQEKSFFAALFDINFTSFVTTRIIKVLYVLSIVLFGIVAFGYTIFAFTVSIGFGLIMLVVIAPLMFLLYLIYTRVILEICMAIFRIMESNFELVALQRQAVGGGGGGYAQAPPPTYPTTPPPPPPTYPTTPPPPAPGGQLPPEPPTA